MAKSLLSTLTLAKDVKRPAAGSPRTPADKLLAAKAKLINSLHEQAILASGNDGQPLTKDIKRYKDGKQEIRNTAVRKHWWPISAGIAFPVKYGTATLKNDDGKEFIFQVADETELPKVIEVISEAARAGEFDASLKTVMVRKPRLAI